MEFTELWKDPLFLDEVSHVLKKVLIDRLKLSNVSKSLHYKVLHLLVTNYFTAEIREMHISDIYNCVRGKGVTKKRVAEVVRELERVGLVEVEPPYVTLSYSTIYIIFNLIQATQNFDSEISKILDSIDTDKMRLGDLKHLAKKFLKDKNYLGYFEKAIVSALFDLYVGGANILKLVFKKIGVDLNDEELENSLLVLDYRTRFNCEGVLYKQIAKFRELVKNATKKYQFALFLTLTTDTKKFKSVLDAYKELSKNWKKLRDAINRRIGEKVEYIAVREFHKNGMPHLHILLFLPSIKDKKGNWVISQKWISRLWEKYQMGSIVWVYALKRANNTYTWLNAFPKGTKTKSITNYLTKYFEKAFNDILELSLFWVSNLRFYTYSRGLKVEKETKPKKAKQWEFLGVCKDDKLREFINEVLEWEEKKKRYEVRNLEKWYRLIERQYYYWICADDRFI